MAAARNIHSSSNHMPYESCSISSFMVHTTGHLSQTKTSQTDAQTTQSVAGPGLVWSGLVLSLSGKSWCHSLGHVVTVTGSYSHCHWIMLSLSLGHVVTVTGSHCHCHWVVGSYCHCHWVMLSLSLGHVVTVTGSYCHCHWVMVSLSLGHGVTVTGSYCHCHWVL